MKTNISKDSAIRRASNLFEGIFGNEVSVRDVFIARGRNLDEEEKNKLWISNLLAPLKRWNIAEPVYGRRNNRRVLERIRLTLEGAMLIDSVRRNATAHGTTIHHPASLSPSASASASPSPSEPAPIEVHYDTKGDARVFESPAIEKQRQLFAHDALSEVLEAILKYNKATNKFLIEYSLKLRG